MGARGTAFGLLIAVGPACAASPPAPPGDASPTASDRAPSPKPSTPPEPVVDEGPAPPTADVELRPETGHRFVPVLSEVENAAWPLHAERRIFATLDGSVFVTAGPQVIRVGPDGAITRDPAWLAGLVPVVDADVDNGVATLRSWDAIHLGGRWPDATFLHLGTRFGSRGSEDAGDVHRWRGDHWEPIEPRNENFDWTPAKTAAWKDDSVLMLRRLHPSFAFMYGEYGDEPDAATIAADKAAVAKAKRLVVARGTLRAPRALARRPILAFDSTADGRILAALGGERPLVVHVAADGSLTEHALPNASKVIPEDLTILAERGAIVWGHGTDGRGPYFARFDGERWQQDTPPPCEAEIGSLSVAPSGTQWATCATPLHRVFGSHTLEEYALWVREPGATWAAVALPGEGYARQVIAVADDDVWVAGDEIYRMARPDLPTAELPDLTTLVREAHEWTSPVADDQWCATVVVVLDAKPENSKALEAALAAKMPGDEYRNVDGAVMLKVAPFRGKRRIVVHAVYADNVPDAAKQLRAALGGRFGQAYCATLPEDHGEDTALATFRFAAAHED